MKEENKEGVTGYGRRATSSHSIRARILVRDLKTRLIISHLPSHRVPPLLSPQSPLLRSRMTSLHPPLIISMGILVCLITTLFATDFSEVRASFRLIDAGKMKQQHQ